MENNNHIREEIENLAPNLSKLEPRKDFIVPENYFYSLSDQIQKKLAIKENKRFSFVFEILHSMFFRYSVGFLVVLMIGFSAYYYSRSVHKAKEVQNTVLTEDYVLDNIETDEMVEYVSDKMTATRHHDNLRKGEKNQRLTKDEIEDNLLENIDESTIIEEL